MYIVQCTYMINIQELYYILLIILHLTKKLRVYVLTSFRLSVFPSFRLSLRDFKKILPTTFIYESILIKLYVNTNVMNTQKYAY